jgi:hypothetical protein
MILHKVREVYNASYSRSTTGAPAQLISPRSSKFQLSERWELFGDVISGEVGE